MRDEPIHVVGAGLAGLVAAITAAETGADVIVREAASRPGGRARGDAGRPGVNLGPHVLFTDGAVVTWLRAREIPVPLLRAPWRGARLLDDRGAGLGIGVAARLAPTVRRRPAPLDVNFRTWTDATFGSSRSELLCRLAGLFTYHHDPGSLAAGFVWERYRRTFLSADRVRWVGGGWATLVDALVARATALGVRIECDARVQAADLPDGPTVVATPLPAAARLLAGRDLSWPGARTALLDVVTRRRPRWPAFVADIRSDLSTCCMVERETAVEPGLLGAEDAELIQAQLGVGPDVSLEAGVGRIEDSLDRAVAGWRDLTVWRRGHVVSAATGAVDPIGAGWRDRPAIDQGDDRFLAGDAVGAPGMLSEVAVNSGVQAARLALAARRRRSFAVGWPSVDLTPERRFAVLAAVLPAGDFSVERRPAGGFPGLEPVDETGPGYRLTRRSATAVLGVTVASDAGAWDAGASDAVAGRRRRPRRVLGRAAHR